MFSAPFSSPTLIDLPTDKNIHFVNTYSPDSDVINKFSLVHNKIIVLLYLGEYHTYTWMEQVLCTSKNYHKKTGRIDNYFVVLSCHKYPESLLKEYADYLSVIFVPSLYIYYTNIIAPAEIARTKKTRHFLSLNSRASVNRQSLFYFFEKFSLLDRAYFSYLGDCRRSDFDSIESISKSIGKPWYAQHLDLAAVHQKIPLRIADDDFKDTDWGTGPDKFYQDTFCSIITETYTAEPYPFFTEKTFKPVAYFHPFIIDCNPGGLQLLRDMGFKTFSAWWDESYDNLAGNHRLTSIFQLILEIGNWSIEKLNQVTAEMQEVLVHNHNHFFTTLPAEFDQQHDSLVAQVIAIADAKQELLG